jgi:cytoskeletal protein RodZ
MKSMRISKTSALLLVLSVIIIAGIIWWFFGRPAVRTPRVTESQMRDYQSYVETLPVTAPSEESQVEFAQSTHATAVSDTEKSDFLNSL